MSEVLSRIFHDRSEVVAIKYSLYVVLVSVMIFAALAAMGESVTSAFDYAFRLGAGA